MNTKKNNKIHLIDNEQGMIFSVQKVQPMCEGYKCPEEIAFLIENIDENHYVNDGDLLLNLSMDEAQKLLTALKCLLSSNKAFYKNIDGVTHRYKPNTKGYDIDVKLNDAFARAVGHSDLGDLLSFDSGLPFDNLMEKYGCIPKYLPLQVNGEDSDIVREANAIKEWKRNKNI